MRFLRRADARARATTSTVLAAAAVASMLSGCAAQPGPAPIAENSSSAQEAPTTVELTPEVPVDKRNRDELVVGIDPLSNGFNPHLLADDTDFVQSLADLVLPSAFHDGKLNTDLLVDATEIPASPTAAQTVRYRIRDDAQWSDASPITGGDFSYLWTNLANEPAVINPAGYRAISSIRTENGGKQVIVDFSTRVENWQSLFDHLLPSHLFSIGTESFDKVLASEIPASGGKYMVRGVDRRRGVVELGRNDRFWGADPAKVELLTFREVTNPTQAAEMLRTKQIGYLDITPAETTEDVLKLVNGVQTRVRSRNAQLQLEFNVTTLSDREVRQGVSSMIDVPLVARIAAGRSADLDIAPSMSAKPEFQGKVSEFLQRPFRIAADPADDQALAAAQAIASMVRSHGVEVELVTTDFADLTKKRFPEGTADAVLAWQRQPDDSASRASQLGCLKSDNGEPIYSGNLTGWCDYAVDQSLVADLAGRDPVDLKSIVADQALTVPIMKDRRLEAVGEGIVGPSSDLATWPVLAEGGSIPTAATWRKK